MQSVPEKSWQDIDPGWAWAPWQPNDQNKWNRARAAHLYRRAAWGASPDQLRHASAQSLGAVLDELFDLNANTEAFRSASEQLAQSALTGGDSKGLATWWLRDMLETKTPLLEKMTLFWHGHFATGADKVKEPQVMLAQNRLLRDQAIGDVSKLVHAISQDAAMLVYLDSAVNRKAHPNENFARELMELFCLGEGNYTERDVQQLARCFTGWEVRRNQFRFNSFQHDTDTKEVLNRQVESGQEAVDVVLNQPQAAQFIVGKLFRFFVADEPAASPQLLEPLVHQLVSDKWQIQPTLRRMLGSNLMFSAKVTGRKVRSPVDWALHWMKACGLSTNLKKVSEGLSELGQALFYPPNVKGWDGGRTWINSSTLVGRTNLISQMVRDPSTRWRGQSMSEFWRSENVKRPEELCRWLEENLLCMPLASATRQRMIAAMDTAGGMDRLEDCLTLAAALPEMQLS